MPIISSSKMRIICGIWFGSRIDVCSLQVPETVEGTEWKGDWQPSSTCSNKHMVIPRTPFKSAFRLFLCLLQIPRVC
jgi:hypothetical protein